ncbi:MAG: DUF3685 domain-containing protein [Cyanobacteria bacterium J06581_3]
MNDLSQRPLQLMLIDEDPVFRLGLKVWLEQQSDFAVVAEAGGAKEALDGVRSRFADYQKSLDDPALRKKKESLHPPIDLVILDLGLGAKDPDTTPGLAVCQQITADFPQLPVLVLSTQLEPVLQAAAERMGASAYGTRSMSVRRLAQLIRQTAVQTDTETKASTAPKDPTTQNTQSQASSSSQPDRRSPAGQRSRARSNALSRLEDIPGPLTAMRISMRLSGMRQIDQNMVDVEVARQQATSWLSQVVLDGKKRELAAAKWLMSALWRTPRFESNRPGSSTSLGIERNRGAASLDWMRMAQGDYGGSYADRTAARYLDRESLVPGARAAIAAMEPGLPTSSPPGSLQGRPGDVQNAVFEGVFAKLQRPLKNISEQPLEIDILRADKKLELLYLVLRQLEELLADLRASQLQPGQLGGRSQQVISDLWDSVNTDFFGKYYTVRVGNVEEEVVTLLQREKPVVQTQILNNIPLVPEMFGHWLFQEPMMIESASYMANTSQAIAYSERLLENLTIQVANAVIQPLLNRLADTEQIKKSLYTSRLMSSRDIERFRNDLSWRYRWDRLINEPKAVFESRYNILILAPNGIEKTSLYAPRRAELDRLKGIPLAVTLALETRDALSPRLRAAVSFIGSGVVYVLTEVLGRGIGLVGRGIFQGMGSAWRDSKNKQRRRPSTRYPDQDVYQNTYVENPYAQDFNEWE